MVELLACNLALWSPSDAATEHRTLTCWKFLNVATTIIGMRRRLMSGIDALNLSTVVCRYGQTFATPADKFGSHRLMLADISGAASQRWTSPKDASMMPPMKTRIIRAGDGEILGSPAGCRDRFLIDSRDWGGNFAVVEHLLAPHSIAAPMHLHTKEDEFSMILEGRVWYVADGEEHVAEVGDLVFKPRGEWHTFFNAADSPARVLELISPGGLEEAFRIIDTATDDIDLGPLVEPYGCEADMEATLPLMEKYALTFG